MWDKDIDKKISRTKTRPLASGEISILHATYFLITMLLIGNLSISIKYLHLVCSCLSDTSSYSISLG